MNFPTIPFELAGVDGAGTAPKVILVAGACLVALVAALLIRRLVLFLWAKKVIAVGNVSRKWVIPEHREWQAKAYVKVPAKNMIEVCVENRTLEFAPIDWKYDRVSEGDQIEVALQRARLGEEIRIVDIGPF